jgi:hypothetical protein
LKQIRHLRPCAAFAFIRGILHSGRQRNTFSHPELHSIRTWRRIVTTQKFAVLPRVSIILMIVGLLLFPASSAFADGNGATTFTQTFHNATQSFVDVTPCRGYPATVNLTYNGVFHTTVNKAGDFWVTGTMTGDVFAVPLDPSLPTFSGHFTTWFGGAENNQNAVLHSTFSVHATGSDGSTISFHDTAHESTNANGVVVVSFDKPVCN